MSTMEHGAVWAGSDQPDDREVKMEIIENAIDHLVRAVCYTIAVTQHHEAADAVFTATGAGGPEEFRELATLLVSRELDMARRARTHILWVGEAHEIGEWELSVPVEQIARGVLLADPDLFLDYQDGEPCLRRRVHDEVAGQLRAAFKKLLKGECNG